MTDIPLANSRSGKYEHAFEQRSFAKLSTHREGRGIHTTTSAEIRAQTYEDTAITEEQRDDPLLEDKRWVNTGSIKAEKFDCR